MFNVEEEKHVDAVLDTPVVDFYNEVLLSYPKPDRRTRGKVPGSRPDLRAHRCKVDRRHRVGR